MGTTCSQYTLNGTCGCFHNDSKVKNIQVIRYTKKPWIWSDNHDNALIESLSDFYEAIPKEIMYLIKDHSFHHTQEYKIIRPVLQYEKYYSKQNQLLHKTLCRKWYLTQTNFSTESVPIGLHVSDRKLRQSIFDVVSATSLPSLQVSKYRLSMAKYEQMMRTIHVDECKIKLHLIAINNNNNNQNNKVLKYPVINMVILNEYDTLASANNTCKMLWDQRNSMKNCMIVKIRDENRKKSENYSKTIDELATCYNIPCVSVCLANEKTITKLFNFAIKYYWFCSVVQ